MSSTKILPFRIALLSLAGALLAGCAALVPLKLEFLDPEPKDILYTNQQARITMQLPAVAEGEKVDLTFRAERPDAEPILIARGDMRPWPGADEATVLWSLRDVAPGDYRLTVANVKGTVKSVPVTVRQPPEVVLDLVGAEGDGDGVLLTFAAKTKSVVPIVLYRWIRDRDSDPVETETPGITMRFPGLGRSAQITLQVFDADGGDNFAITTLTLPTVVPVAFFPGLWFQAVPLNFCGCKQMTIRRDPKKQSPIYCAKKLPPKAPHCKEVKPAAIPKGPGVVRCKAGEIAFRCPYGPEQPGTRFTGGVKIVGGKLVKGKPKILPLAFGFEVAADLEDGSDPAKCIEGQLAKADLKVDGVFKDVSVAPEPRGGTPIPIPAPPGGTGRTITPVKPQPPGGPLPRYPRMSEGKWGGDNYVKKGDLKTYVPPLRIRWMDLPSVGVKLTPPISNTASLHAEFISYVLGRGGGKSCWCQFSIGQEWKFRRNPAIKPLPGRGKIFKMGTPRGLRCAP